MPIQLAQKRVERFDYEETITDEQVAEHLRNNPEFFKNYEDVLVGMDFSNNLDGNVTSIYDFQLRKVRKKTQQLEEKNRLLVQTALQNMQTEAQIHGLVLSFLRAGSYGDLNALLQGDLKSELNLDFIQLMPVSKDLSADYIDNFFNTQTNVKLRTLCDGVDTAMYNGETTMESDALLRLHTPSAGTIGLLVMGSQNRARFHAGQASDLLEFVAQVLALCVERLEK